MKALIVCADKDTARKISHILKPSMECDTAKSMQEAAAMDRASRYGLYFLDMAIAGADYCRVMRKRTSAPIIFISYRYNEAEAVAGFDAGADDYLSLPFGELELCSRVRAILRRCDGRCRTLADWIDIRSHTAVVDGRTVHLTPMEFEILMELVANGGKVVPKSKIIKDVWGSISYATDDALKVRINSLRSKIGKDRIETVRGHGYRLVTEK